MSARPHGRVNDFVVVTAPEVEITVATVVWLGQKEILWPVDAAQPGTGIEVELCAYIGQGMGTLDQSECVAIWGQDAVDDWIQEAIDRAYDWG